MQMELHLTEGEVVMQLDAEVDETKSLTEVAELAFLFGDEESIAYMEMLLSDEEMKEWMSITH
jgi:hypothetical protein